jgi:AraC family transcriptional regulator of adaptative response / methylphosphotriester-DNA alkyltransferase methyltransferase
VQLLQRAVKASTPGRRPWTHERRLDIFHEAIAIVEAEFPRPITVYEVARRVATSPRQLHRAFSEVGGVSFRSFLMSVRMAHAAELLAATDVPVAEVGRRVGYRQPGQFTKAFKRTHGETPSRFRAQRRGSSTDVGKEDPATEQESVESSITEPARIRRH